MECPILIGKAYCGHCGARLVATTNGKKYVRKDGEVAKKYRTRYVCYNKTRHKHKCDGQTGYTVSKLDKMIDEVVHRLFAGLSDLPKETIIRKRYKKDISEKQTAFTQAKADLQAQLKELSEYETETIKVIRGGSKLSSELLSKLYKDARNKKEECKVRVAKLEESLEDSEH